VVIAGGVGVGKTWLARSILDELATAGHAVERLAGTRAVAGIPFGAVTPLLPATIPSGRRGSEVLDLMTAILGDVTSRAREGRLVVGLDDAHCLDGASAAVILQLALTDDAFLVVTTRTGEPAPDAIQVLWKDGLAERLELQPLSHGEVRELLETVLGGPVEEPCSVELARISSGNALFLRELIRAAVDDGSLVVDHGSWRLRRRPSPPAHLVELIERRMDGLPVATRNVVDLVAAGEPLSLATLERLTEPSALADADRSGIIAAGTVGRRSQVRLDHPLYGEVLRTHQSPSAWRRLCRTLAEDLAATGLRRADDVVRFVTWRLDAGLDAAVDQLLAAHHRALEGNDLVAAERFARAALDVAAHGTPTEQVLAAVAWSDVSARQLRFGAALDVLDSLGLASLTADQTVEVTETRATLLFLDGRPDEAEDLLIGAERQVGVDAPAQLARLRLTRARLVGGRGRPLAALALLDEVAGTVPDSLVAWDLQVRGPALGFAGRYDDAEAVALRGLDPDLPHPGEVTVAVDWVASVLLLVAFGRGRLDDVEALVAPYLDGGLVSGHRARRRAAAAAFGWACFERGDLDRAIGLLREGTGEDGGLESDGLSTLAYAGLASSHVLAGNLEQAQLTLTRAAARSCPPVRWFDPLLAIGRALLAYRQGLTGEARGIIGETLDECAVVGLRAPAMYVAGAACRVGAADLAVPALRGLVPEMQTPMPRLLLAWAEALVAEDAAGLGAAGDEFERRGMLLIAAEAAGVAAELHARYGRARDAGAASTAARRRGERCPGADLGFLDRCGVEELTGREREVARLAASGHSSADIAQRLFISVRTVDNHLGRAYIKLGVNGRDDLAVALGRMPVPRSE
jgi:DNA-binding CsgD family transcriptional regulator/tetratricopeptide (TPR) repeat protein